MKTPQSESELWQRACKLAGKSLASIAQELDIAVPENLRVEKGWLGQLLERALGAGSGSLAQADFPELGIELKSLPIALNGVPTESTWVCVADLTPSSACTWENSLVYEKLKKVLWVPVQDVDDIPLAERRVGSAILWTPNETQMAALRTDYLELTERIAMGEIEAISAHHGQALQLRPKAANRKVLTEAIGPDGFRIHTLPRGYYLRRQFTYQILQAHLL